MNRSMVSALGAVELHRIQPLFLVTALIGLGGGIARCIPLEGLDLIGYMIIRHLPVVFALILGADMVARDREQRTLIMLSSLPVSPLMVWIVRSVFRLFPVMLLGCVTSAYLRYTDPEGVVISLVADHPDYLLVPVPILFLFGYFSAVLCSLFSTDTLSSIGAAAIFLVIGTNASVWMKRSHITIGIAIMTVILAVASMLIYLSRHPWTLTRQARILVSAGFVIGVLLYWL
ncbi:hypothetical protein JXA80_00320 [bacterium]|nr:hypothetical protein [candidate division CSSED10-310 bacterium]